MKRIKRLRAALFGVMSSAILIACGGGGSTSSPSSAPVVSLSSNDTVAIEQTNDQAKFIVTRSGATSELNIAYTLSGSSDSVMGSASPDDYQLFYSDGGPVGTQIQLGSAQNTRVIEVRPTADNQHEVPELLNLSLESGSGYTLGTETQTAITISDATNEPGNDKVFIGTFGPQEGAATSASGSLSFILSGDNMSGRLSYSFSNLTSLQTDQHLHLAPSGTVIEDIEISGSVRNFLWGLEPGGPFTTRQQLLDALFNGEIFLNIHTANFPEGEISATLNFDANNPGPGSGTLTEESVDRDIIRFLTQATFGPTPETYQALRDQIDTDGANRMQVYEAWIDNEFSKTQTNMLELTDATVNVFASEDAYRLRRDAFWPIAVYGKDQLRQRVAFALSEILVIGDHLTPLRRAHRGVADYWDTLATQAFGSYRDALEDASRHTVMGFWLSHLRNRKADPSVGYYPDENYAREIMQLFSFGLIQREKNGSVKLGNDNLPMPTYNNDVIQEMARVFTGMAMGSRNSNGNIAPNNSFNLNNNANDFQYRWTEPMRFFPANHDYGAKVLFADEGSTLEIDESNTTDIATADAELDNVLDAILAHSSTAPYISQILIQRLVTSNPSGAYIERVANAFGSMGNMRAVVKAILLDPEARNPEVVDSERFGKFKEPIVQFSALFRLLRAGSEIPLGAGANGLSLSFSDKYDDDASLMRLGDQALGQYSLGSPTVFNFFSPDFSPTGDLAANSLVAPELQSLTESQLFIQMNIVHKLLGNGFVRFRSEENSPYTRDQLRVKLKFDAMDTLWSTTPGTSTEKAEALVDWLDFYLNSGQLKATNNTATRSQLIAALASAAAGNRNNLAIYGIMVAPEFMVQR